MKLQLALILSIFVVSVVHANPRLVRRQAPTTTGPVRGPTEPAEPETPAVEDTPATAGNGAAAVEPASSGAVAEDTALEAQPRAARPIGSRGRPGPQPVAPQPEVIVPQPSAAEEGPAAPSVFTLPDGADEVVGEIKAGFSCDDKIYGYYADPNNDCKIFHVCVPLPNDVTAGANYTPPPPLHFSFFCNNGTVFNQEALVCDYSANVDCSLATSYYSVNEEFGKIPVENAEGRGPAPASPNAPAPGASAHGSPTDGLQVRGNVPTAPVPVPAGRVPAPSGAAATPRPTTAAATIPVATGSVTAPETTVNGASPEASATAEVPGVSASGAVPGVSASAAVPGVSASAAVPGVSASVAVPGVSASADLPEASASVTLAPDSLTPALA